MASNKKRTSSVGAAVFMIGAVLCAAVAGVLVSRLMARSYPNEAVVSIVVAARDISAGRPLSSEDLRLAQWPESSVPRGAFSSTQSVLGQAAVPLKPMVAGEALLASHLSQPRSGFGVAAKLGPGQRAVAFQATSSVTLARLVYPSARVDLLTTMKRPGSRGSGEVKTKVLLQNVLVLAVGPEIDAVTALRRQRVVGRNKALSVSSSANRGARRVVTVSLTSPQAERVILANREGKIDVMLRSPQDEAIVSTTGATTEGILGAQQVKPPRRTVVPPPKKKVAPPPPRKRSPRRSSRRRRPRVVPKPTPTKVAPSSPRIHRGGSG